MLTNLWLEGLDVFSFFKILIPAVYYSSNCEWRAGGLLVEYRYQIVRPVELQVGERSMFMSL